MRFFIIILFLINSYVLEAQSYYKIYGSIIDSFNNPISGVSVMLKNDNFGTVTDNKGSFFLNLEQGYYILVFKSLGFQTKEINIALTKDINLDIILSSEDISTKAIEVNSKKTDISWQIIKNIISEKEKNYFNFQNLQFDAYIKASQINIIDSTKEKKKKTVQNADSFLLKTTKPKIPFMNIAEINLSVSQHKKGYIKEERHAVLIKGNKHQLFYTSFTDGPFNIFDPLINLGTLTEVRYLSPFNPTALINYKYKLLKSYYIDNQKYYKIKITPRLNSNAVVSGTIIVKDSNWVVIELDLDLNTNQIPQYTYFNYKEKRSLYDSLYLIESKSFTYKRGQWNGKTQVLIENYKINPKLPKNYYGNEVSKTTEDAYLKDSLYWQEHRKIELSIDEKKFIKRTDSLFEIRNSQKYLDSIDQIFNKVTVLKLLYWGQGYVNRKQELRINYAPLISVFQPGMIGGFRLGYWVGVSKKFKNKKVLSLYPYLHYGFLNKDLKGNFNSYFLYNPLNRSYLGFYGGRDFRMINFNEAFLNMFKRSNFYEWKHFGVRHSIELFNGFYLSKFITISSRNDIGNYKFSKLGDDIFPNGNTPVKFESHKSLEYQIGISYTPYQKYIKEPKEKIILGSKWPTFNATFNQGVNTKLWGNTKFKSLSFSIYQTLNLGRFGVSKYAISTNKYIDTSYLPLVDYQFHRKGDPILLTNPLGAYQLLQHTFSTFDWYFKVNFMHRFNGFLTSAIYPLKKAGINATAGGAILLSKEKNLSHIELFFGGDRIFKLMRETVRIGIYYSTGYNNIWGYNQGFKISFEKYNIRDNSWSF